jgi:hypothetical protein
MMVAATDFNLGDWVYLKNGSGVAPVQVDAGIMDRLRQPTAPADEVFEPIPLTLQLLESADFHFVRTPDGAMKHGTIDTAMIRHSITEEGDNFSLLDALSHTDRTLHYLHELQQVFRNAFNHELHVHF